MDISTLGTVSEDQGILVHLKNAAGQLLYDGEGEAATPVTVLVAGTYSERFRKAKKRLAQRKAPRRHTPQDAEFWEAFDEDAIALQAACIIEWTFTSNGEPFPVTVANYTALIAKQPQFQEQIDQAMGDHARFFSGSSPA